MIRVMTPAPGDRADIADVVVSRRYPVPIDAVWAELTEPDRLSRWYGTYTGVGGPGGTVELTVTGEVDAGGEIGAPTAVGIVECEAPWRLVVDIGEAPSPWHLALTLSAESGATVLLLTQRPVEGVSTEDLVAGWSWYLERLAASLADEPMPAWEGGPGS